MSDSHYATDVLLGTGLGLLGGYVLPEVLHYQLGVKPLVPTVQSGSLRAAIAPRVDQNGLGFTMAGSS